MAPAGSVCIKSKRERRMKRLAKRQFIIYLAFIIILVSISSGCSKADVSGRWKLTLKWDKRAVYEGKPPPPTIFQLVFKDGRVYHEEKEVGEYLVKGKRLRVKLRKMKVICYGDLEGENRCRGEISYYPAGEIYGTWTGEREGY